MVFRCKFGLIHTTKHVYPEDDWEKYKENVEAKVAKELAPASTAVTDSEEKRKK